MATRAALLPRFRPCDIERRADVWIFRPQTHKTEHHDRHREVFLGPRAISIVTEWLGGAFDTEIFRKPRGKPYSERDYYCAIQGVLTPQDKTDPGSGRARLPNGQAVPRWSPNQLRHNAGTLFRKELGPDTAQVLLGHAHLNTTEIYAEADRARAIKAARELG